MAVIIFANFQKCLWHFLIFARYKTKSDRDKSVIFLRNFKSLVKVNAFFSRKSSLVIHWFETRKFRFFAAQKEEKDKLFFVYQESFIRHSFKIWWGFNYFIKTYLYIFFPDILCVFFLAFLFLEKYKCHKFSWSKSRFFSIVKKKELFQQFNQIVPKLSSIDFVHENKVRHLCTQNKGYLR